MKFQIVQSLFQPINIVSQANNNKVLRLFSTHFSIQISIQKCRFFTSSWYSNQPFSTATTMIALIVSRRATGVKVLWNCDQPCIKHLNPTIKMVFRSYGSTLITSLPLCFINNYQLAFFLMTSISWPIAFLRSSSFYCLFKALRL